MVELIFVRPNETEIKENLVALWDQDPAHFEADPFWRETGGAFVAGNSVKPEATYRVARTGEVEQAIKRGRLVRVNDEPDESAKAAAVVPVEAPAPVAPAAPQPADIFTMLTNLSPDQLAQLRTLLGVQQPPAPTDATVTDQPPAEQSTPGGDSSPADTGKKKAK